MVMPAGSRVMPDSAKREISSLSGWLCLCRGWLLVLLLPLVSAAAQVDVGNNDRLPLIIELDKNRRLQLQVELAADPSSRRTGLMYRQHLPERTGMLFDYGQEQSVQMWMKNTLIPLDMLFIDAHGCIVHIVENTEPGSGALIDPGRPVRAVLEINAGASARHGIRTGHRVRHAIFGNMPAR